MASAVRPGVLLENGELVFLLDGKRERHASKLFLGPNSLIKSVPDASEGFLYVFNPLSALKNDRVSALCSMKDDTVRVLADKLHHKDAIMQYPGPFMLGFYKDAPGLIFKSSEAILPFLNEKHTSSSAISDVSQLAPGNVLFMPIAAPLESKWGKTINVEEVKWKDVSAYAVEAVKPETPAKATNAAELRKEAVMRLARNVAVFKDQDILDDKQTLSQYSHARAELLKFLRMNCRWETDATFWSQKVWWRCEIFCQHPDAPKKISSLIYGVDYFFDVFHLVEVFERNPDFISSKKAIPFSELHEIAAKYQKGNFGSPSSNLNLPSRIYQLATHWQYDAFREFYFQEMLNDDGWEIFEVSSESKHKKGAKVPVYFIPPEHRRRLKISQDNFDEFERDRDYFTKRELVVDYVLQTYSTRSTWHPDPTADKSSRSSKTAAKKQPGVKAQITTVKPTSSVADVEVASEYHEDVHMAADLDLPQSKGNVDAADSRMGEVVQEQEVDIAWSGPVPSAPEPLPKFERAAKPSSIPTNTSAHEIAPIVSCSLQLDCTPVLPQDEAKRLMKQMDSAYKRRHGIVDPEPAAPPAVEEEEDDEDGEDDDEDEDDVIFCEEDEVDTSGADTNQHAESDPDVIRHQGGVLYHQSDNISTDMVNKLMNAVAHPGVTIGRKTFNDDPRDSLLLYIVEYPTEEVTSVPIPVGCDPRYVENIPTTESLLKKQQEQQQRIGEEAVLTAFAASSTRDDPAASVSGSKRLGSSRAAANKKSRSDGSSARYSLNEELYGYTIY